ncbi:MAG: C10 family peptidase, partial [Paludibacteraceae bacterium]|nr:C10 family peptidase [Paludibacteraceae bacterium]
MNILRMIFSKSKRCFSVLMISLISISFALGNPVELNKAKTIATSFITRQQTNGSKNRIPQQIQLQQVTGITSNHLYVFNISSGGFVIVSGDDIAQPILGYSSTGNIPNEELPINVKYWFDRYDNEIQTAIDSNYTQSEEVAQQWANLPINMNNIVIVGPLLTTAWNQAPLYNELCPYDSTKNSRTVTGCVATGMAQIINYWEHPIKGIGGKSYEHIRYGNLSADFQNTTYNYNLMPDTLKSTSTAAEINSVATLMYHCGISVNMNYNVSSEGGSSAFSNDIVSAMKKYWEYSNDIRMLSRDYYWRFPDSIKTELLAQRPVLLSGSGEGGGHLFVTDGFDSNNYFHINWGWGGLFDGYYSLNALNPGIGGIGSGSGSYNENLNAIIGIKPAQHPSFNDNTNNLQLTSNLTTDQYEIEYLNGFTISASIKNNATTNFVGDIAFVVFDLDFTTVFDTIGLQSKTINAGAEETITFTFPGSTEYTGIHIISLITRNNGGQWHFINNNGFTNRCQIEFVENKTECGLIYKCDFETALKGWTFDKAIGINSGFVADTAISNSGDKSLYLSSDGGATQSYSASTNGYVSVAYKKLYLEKGNYETSFTYKGIMYDFFESSLEDYIYFKLIPANQTPQSHNQY